MTLRPDPDCGDRFGDADQQLVALARIENHYFMHGGFWTRDRSSRTWARSGTSRA